MDPDTLAKYETSYADLRDSRSPGAKLLRNAQDNEQMRVGEEREKTGLAAYTASPISQDGNGPAPEQYDYPELVDERPQGLSPDQNGNVSLPNKYIKPLQVTIGGVDVSNRQVISSHGLSREGVSRVQSAVDIIAKSNSRTDGAVPEQSAVGLTGVAAAYAAEQRDFNDFVASVTPGFAPVETMRAAWVAGDRAAKQEAIRDDLEGEILNEQRGRRDWRNVADQPDDDRISTADLYEDSQWVSDAHEVYGIIEGGQFEGSPEELVDWSREAMAMATWSTTRMAQTFLDLDDATPQQAEAFMRMLDTWETVRADGDTLVESIIAASPYGDPAAWIAGMAIGGVTVKAASLLARGAAIGSLRALAASKAAQAVAVGTLEGAMIAGVEDVAQQGAEVQAGRREEIDPNQAAASATMGAAVGGVFAGALGGAGRKGYNAFREKYLRGSEQVQLSKGKQVVARTNALMIDTAEDEMVAEGAEEVREGMGF